LVAFILSRLSKRLGKKIDGASRESMEYLLNYPWPGNIRELQNVIERAVIVSTEPMIRLDRDLIPVIAGKGHETQELNAPGDREARIETPSPPQTLAEVERNHILSALQHSAGVIEGPKGAARILGLHPNTLRHRMQRLGVRVSRSRPSWVLR
jgi:formate hydrogenlyase transcriptional activator